MVRSRIKFSATNTTNVTTESPKSDCAPMDWSLIPTAEKGSLAIITSTSRAKIGSNCVSGLRKRERLRVSSDCNVPRYFSESPRGVTNFCPRLNGYYAHPVETECRLFYSCVDGVAEKHECAIGLYFDEYSGTCNWPEQTDRLDCINGEDRIHVLTCQMYCEDQGHILERTWMAKYCISFLFDSQKYPRTWTDSNAPADLSTTDPAEWLWIPTRNSPIPPIVPNFIFVWTGSLRERRGVNWDSFSTQNPLNAMLPKMWLNGKRLRVFVKVN